ncbi:hypothetical protein MD484_g8035, partial [Candolleomyces efflorescens]
MKLVRLLINSDLERGCGIVERALRLLDKSVMPSVRPFQLKDLNVRNAVEGAFTGLVLLGRMFRCFKLDLPSYVTSKMRALQEMCLARIVERWSDVTDWMLAIVAGAGRNGSRLLGLCAETMECIIHPTNVVADEDDLSDGKRELVSLPSTAHIICTLLAQTPKSQSDEDETYFYIAGASNECVIIELFCTFVSTEAGRRSFLLALNSYDSKMKRRVVDSLAYRPEQFAEDSLPPGQEDDDAPYLRASYATSLYRLIQGLARIFQDDEAILRCFVRRDFVGICAYALDSLSENPPDLPAYALEFWEFLSEATVCFLEDIVLKRTKKPYQEFAQALEDGIFLCAERCLVNVKSRNARERLLCVVFAELCNYCMSEDVCMARASRYEEDVTQKVSETYLPQFFPMIDSLGKCLGECAASLRPGTQRLVNLCCNLNHSQKPLDPNGEEVEDWERFHSKECRTLARLYRGNHNAGPAWPSLALRRDLLRYVRQSMKLFTWKFGMVRFSMATPHLGTEECAKLNSLMPTYPVSRHRDEIWKHINGIWGPRIEACVELVEKHPETSVLVDAAFAYGSDYALYVLAVVMFDEDRPAEDPERFSIVDAVFRFG